MTRLTPMTTKSRVICVYSGASWLTLQMSKSLPKQKLLLLSEYEFRKIP